VGKYIKDGRLHGYVMGEVTYRDRLDDTIVHDTQFAWEVIDVNIHDVPANILAAMPDAAPQVTVGFRPFGQHNCADDECPKDSNK
jgi:hypothetical protein